MEESFGERNPMLKELRMLNNQLCEIKNLMQQQTESMRKNDKRMDDMLLYFKKYSSGEMSMTEVINQLS